MHALPTEAEQGDTLPSCSSSRTATKCPMPAGF